MTILNPHMLPKLRSKAIMRSAKGKPCSLRIASLYIGHRCDGPETTICAHLPIFGKGMKTKVTDTAVVYACIACHDILDGVDMEKQTWILERYPTAFYERLIHGQNETLLRMIMDGIIVVPDARVIK